jgi:hypothetical protein
MGVIFTVDYQAGFAKVRGSQNVIVALQSALKCHSALWEILSYFGC